MSRQIINIYMAGVGGQGIGLLAEALARAADYAGFQVAGCDTHGLAQRGGVVTSHLRLGSGVRSPLVEARGADLVIALERHEALRADQDFLKPGGTLLYYDACWQPLPVRLGQADPVSVEDVERACASLEARCLRVINPALEDPRMQNTALLREIATLGLVPGMTKGHLAAALADLLEGDLLQRNLDLLT